jgi:3-hydroxybutyryl-CoA dehydrogenase
MTSATDNASPTAAPKTPADITDVIVVGAGQMGSGIAQVFAQAGRNVQLVDVADSMLDRARSGIVASAEKLHAKGRIDDAALASVRNGIEYRTSVTDAAPTKAQFAIEAITEHEPTKLSLVRELDAALTPGAIIASNTSSIPITRIAAATERADRVVGMHFMNPVPVLDLVEVIPGLATTPDITQLVCDLARDLGKVPVESADSPGFITNRVLMPLINEAFFCLHEQVGTAEAIDDAMRLGMRHPMGPLALADLIGLDTTLAILEVLHRDLGDDKYRPCPLLRRYVDAGKLGRKSGAGVYRYDS